LLHRCDSNGVFIVDVSRVYALCNLFLRWQETELKRTHTAFPKLFRVVHEKKIKNALEVGSEHFKKSPNFNIFVVECQAFTKFSIRWPVSRYIL